jgi:proteasome lid subunit RPN8/RPN11
MSANWVVVMDDELLKHILECAKRVYPRETIALLRGKVKKEVLTVSELVIPPLATHGRGFANIPLYMLPMDFSIIGSVHSHPSGNLRPSVGDLNHFFGRILMIAGFPYVDVSNVAVYDRNATKLTLQVTEQ